VRRWSGVLLLLGVAVLIPRPASAQLFGQWSWDAILGLESRSYLTEIDDATLTDYSERSLRLGLGLNGYVIHPAIARFRLGLDATISTYSGSKAPDSNRWGIFGNLGLFPFSRYPSHYFLSLSKYDYTIDSDDPLATTGLADTSTSWGARIRLRGSFLKGLTAGIRRTDTSFVDPSVRDEIFSNQYIDWTGASGGLNHHYRLERNFRRYGRTRYDLEDYFLTVDEHGPIAERWRWDLSGSAFHRTTNYESSETAVDTGRLRNRFVYTTRRNDTLDLSYTGGISRSDTMESTFQSHAGTIRYTWMATEELHVIPMVGYTYQKADATELDGPSAGVDVVWTRVTGRWDLSLNGGIGGSWIGVRWDDGSQDSTNLYWSAGATVGTGTEEKLRAEVTASVASNELRTVGDPLLELPDLGTEYERIGTQDSARARLALRKRFARWHLNAYLEHWQRRQEVTTLPTIEVGTTTANLALDGPRAGLGLSAGNTSGRTTGARDQEVRFYSLSAHWSPLRALVLRFSYIDNRSQVENGPDVDRQRLQGSARYTFGRWAFFGQAWDQRETVSARPRRNRGYVLGVSARFGGWLPFVSAPQRRGMIR